MLKVLVRLQGALAVPPWRADRGATAVEYGLLVTFIALVIVAAVTSVGAKLVAVFTNVTNGF